MNRINTAAYPLIIEADDNGSRAYYDTTSFHGQASAVEEDDMSRFDSPKYQEAVDEMMRFLKNETDYKSGLGHAERTASLIRMSEVMMAGTEVTIQSDTTSKLAELPMRDVEVAPAQDETAPLPEKVADQDEMALAS